MFHFFFKLACFVYILSFTLLAGKCLHSKTKGSIQNKMVPGGHVEFIVLKLFAYNCQPIASVSFKYYC